MLCVRCFRDNPNDRLGYGSKGLDNLQKHKWFDGFDWNGLTEGKLKAPIIPVVNILATFENSALCSIDEEYANSLH